MLNGVLTLHDIKDVEAFTAAILKGRRDEDLHAYLIEETWLLSTRYKPGGNITFSTWARTTLERRLIDYTRKEQGDHRYHSGRNRPELISIDMDTRPHDTQPQTHRDPPPHRDASDLVRLLRTRSSDEAWNHNKRRQSLPNRAA
jgi:DNA-directed RNA polymerase specialized sigma24 family protein